MSIADRLFGRLAAWEPLLRQRRAAATARIVKPALWPASHGVVSFAFDDVPSSAWTVGGRVLAAAGAKATYYIAGGIHRLPPAAGTPWHGPDDLDAIHAAGHEIACHGFDHRSALLVSARAFEASLRRNAAFLAGSLGCPWPRSFAYPYGDVALGAKRVAARAFRSARGTDWGLNEGRFDLAQLKAVGLETRTAARLDLPALAAQAAERRSWLILYTHDVQPEPTPWGCTPQTLEAALRTVLDAGLQILTVGQAAELAREAA